MGKLKQQTQPATHQFTLAGWLALLSSFLKLSYDLIYFYYIPRSDILSARRSIAN